MPRIAVLSALSLALLAPAAETAAQAPEAADGLAWCEIDLAPAPARAFSTGPEVGRAGVSFAPACLPGSAAAAPSRDAARRAWASAVEALESEVEDPVAIADALVALSTVRAYAPELSDRVALLSARLEHALGPTEATCDRYAEAIESPLPSVVAQARVGRTLCLLEIGDRDGVEALETLERRYHELPSRNRLHLALAEALEGWGRTNEAVDEYRELDLEEPGSAEARTARERLAVMAAAGVRVRGFSLAQEIERAERLVRSGPPSLARDEVERLRARELPSAHAAEVALMAARIARVEGRFADADALMREARGLEPLVGDDPAAVETVAGDLADAASARDEEEAMATLRRMGFGRAAALRGRSGSRLYMMARVAARAGLEEPLHTILDEELRRIERRPEDESCVLRFDMAIISAGTADDERVARLLDGCEGDDARGVAARYHRARALERLGRTAEARNELEAVCETDPTDTGFYALWARTRLGALDPVPPPNPFDDAPVIVADEPWRGVPWADGAKTGEVEPRAAEAAPSPPPPAATSEAPATGDEELEPEDADDAAPEPSIAMSEDDVAIVLATLAERHGEAFPWLARARALVLLGAPGDAAEELFTFYEAMREAEGHAPLRAGLEAVYRGAAPARIPTSLALRRARRSVSYDDRRTLADVAASLGDFGLSTRFGGPGRAAAHPRPYEPIVRAAAARHGIDPNLIWAVMRVESIYNPGIVSYAGAIGLMQIMPRTGRLIAHDLGREDFTTAELLDPETNIELAAWYLSSLLERFDGRTALAIAAYNGGPHNVRRWMEDHGRDLPVESLCERIPFDQTFRYVRRVLHHYAAYRTGDGLSLPALETAMPGASVDRVAF